MIYTASEIARHATTTQASVDGRTWHPARPRSCGGLRLRLRATWLVLTGRADAVTWPTYHLGRAVDPIWPSRAEEVQGE